MKKNPFLTFVFACIPGAGQMYYGYMLRGLSLISIFCAGFCLGLAISPLVVICAIVWMYSFFDTYDLIRYLVAGEPKPDTLLLVGDIDHVKALIPRHSKLLGWGLVGLGVWSLYAMLVEPLLYRALYALGIDDAWSFVHDIPALVVAVLLVLAGLWLLGLHPAKKTAELPAYPTDFEEPAAPQPADPAENAALTKLRAELDAGVPAAPDLPKTENEE